MYCGCDPVTKGKSSGWIQLRQTFRVTRNSLIMSRKSQVWLPLAKYVEALIISYGEGANGKSTFWNTLPESLGSYSGTLSADALTANCKRNVKAGTGRS
jgi:hypothetical protein